MSTWNVVCANRARGWLVACIAMCATVIAARPFSTSSPNPNLPPELQKIRAAFEKYQNPIVAIHDGYLSTVGCMEYPKAGAAGQAPYPAGGMGVHFFNPSLVGPTVDPERPTVLLYEPAGRELRLVAVEWFVPLATGVMERPRLFGADFDGPMEGHHPLMPLEMHHYDLHVWLFKDNPAGMFRPTNPTVKCGDYPFSFQHEPPRLVAAR